MRWRRAASRVPVILHGCPQHTVDRPVLMGHAFTDVSRQGKIEASWFQRAMVHHEREGVFEYVAPATVDGGNGRSFPKAEFSAAPHGVLHSRADFQRLVEPLQPPGDAPGQRYNAEAATRAVNGHLETGEVWRVGQQTRRGPQPQCGTTRPLVTVLVVHVEITRIIANIEDDCELESLAFVWALIYGAQKIGRLILAVDGPQADSQPDGDHRGEYQASGPNRSGRRWLENPECACGE